VGSKKNIWNAGTLNIHVPDGLCLLESWRLQMIWEIKLICSDKYSSLNPLYRENFLRGRLEVLPC